MARDRRLKDQLTGSGTDVLIVTSPENVYYASGYSGLERDFGAGVFIPADGESAVLVPKSGFGSVPSSEDLDVRKRVYYGEYYARGLRIESAFGDLLSAVSGLIDGMGAAHPRVAVEMGRLSVDDYARLCKKLPHAEFVDAGPLLREARIIKSPEEIKRITECAHVTEQALLKSYGRLAAGTSELETARFIRESLDRRDADPLWVEMGFGARGAFSDMRPSDYRARKGDIAFIDLGSRKDGYCSDFSRSAVIGKPSEEQRRTYAALFAGQEAAISMVGPGVRASELFAAAIETVRRSGIRDYDRHYVGHGVGVSPHEDPRLGRSTETVLRPGMVLAIEMVYRSMGHGGYNVEDLVLVTKKGHELLTSSKRDSLFQCPTSGS